MKNKEDLEVKKVLAGIGKNIANKKWACIVSGCDHKAINSHLLQRHGVLSNIVEQGHCYELRERDIFSWAKDEPPVEFKKCGLEKTVSLPIFCNYHDTELFKSIESGEVDYSNYHNQLLLSYRSICAEIRRKEMAVEKYNRYLKSHILRAYRCGYFSILPDAIKGNEVGLKDLVFYKDAIEKELIIPHGTFYFVHHTYPIKGIYASSHFSIGDLEETANLNDVMPDCIGHAIPNGDNTELIFGYHKDYVNKNVHDFVYSWDGLNKEQLGEKLTGWFTLIESWGLSPSLYEKLESKDLERYFELLEISYRNVNQNPNVGFNLFSGLL